VVSSGDQQLTDAELCTSEQSDSEPMVVDTCPVQSVPAVSDVKSSVSSLISAKSLVPADINFNCSSSHIYVQDNEFHVDVATLRRPALFDEATSEVVEEIDADLVEHNDDVVPGSHDAVLTRDAVDEVAISTTDVNSSHRGVAVTDEVPPHNHRYAVSAGDLFTLSCHDALPADEEVCTSRVHEMESSDDNVLSNVHDVVNVDAESEALLVNCEDDEFHVGVTTLRRPALFDEAASEVVDSRAKTSDAADTEAVPAAADVKNVTVADVDSVVSAANSKLLTQDVHVGDEYQLSSQQPYVPHLGSTSDVSASPDIEKHADETFGGSEPQFSEVISESVATCPRSVEAVLSDASSKQLADASVDIVTSVEHEFEDLKREMDNRERMDVAENESDVVTATKAVSQSDTEPCASDVETRQQGEVEVGERHAVMEKLESDASDVDLQHSAASPTSMFLINYQLLQIILFCILGSFLVWNV